MSEQPVTLDMFGDVLDLNDLAKLCKKGPRYFEQWITAERQDGIRCLPDSVPGLKHRYPKDAVRRWLKVGAPQMAGRHGKKG